MTTLSPAVASVLRSISFYVFLFQRRKSALFTRFPLYQINVFLHANDR